MSANNSEFFSVTIDLPIKILDSITDTLSRVGIELPPFALQLCLLILVVATLALTVQKIRRSSLSNENREKNRPLIIGAIGQGLIIIAILFVWAEQILFPFPQEIKGRVDVLDASGSFSYSSSRVHILDYRDRELGSSFIDTTNGNFAVYWEAGFGIRPRKIRVSAAGCKDSIRPISHDNLRKGVMNMQFSCGG